MKLNIGCGKDIRDGWVNLDQIGIPNIDIAFDLDRCGIQKIPGQTDNSIDYILMSHVLEHLSYPLDVMQELHRVSKHGTICQIKVPHGSSDDAHEDPTHKKIYFEGSFGYFSQPFYWRADYGYRGDWKTERIVFVVDKSKFSGHAKVRMYERIRSERNCVLQLVVFMSAVKPIREQVKELQEVPVLEIQLV